MFRSPRLCFVGLGLSNSVGSEVGSGVVSEAGILSRFFIGSILLLKILILFSLALKNNLVLFRKDLFLTVILPFSIPISLLTKSFCSLSASSIDNFFFHVYLLKKTMGNEHLMKFFFFSLVVVHSILSNLILFYNCLIPCSLPIIKSFYWFFGNILSICFNSFILLEKFKSFKG